MISKVGFTLCLKQLNHDPKESINAMHPFSCIQYFFNVRQKKFYCFTRLNNRDLLIINNNYRTIMSYKKILEAACKLDEEDLTSAYKK